MGGRADEKRMGKVVREGEKEEISIRRAKEE